MNGKNFVKINVKVFFDYFEDFNYQNNTLGFNQLYEKYFFQISFGMMYILIKIIKIIKKKIY